MASIRTVSALLRVGGLSFRAGLISAYIALFALIIPSSFYLRQRAQQVYERYSVQLRLAEAESWGTCLRQKAADAGGDDGSGLPVGGPFRPL